MPPHLVGDGQQGDRQQRPETRPATAAAFMIVDDRGTVVRVTGWEKTFGRPAPERLAPPDGDDDRLLACLVEAIDEAGTTGGLARRTAHYADPPRAFDIAAASLAIGGGGVNTAIMVQPSKPHAPAGSGGEGGAIRKLDHDLRSPLTSISGAAELLESSRLGRLNEQQTKCLGVIHKGVEVMLDLLMTAAAPYRQAKALSNPPAAEPRDDEEGGQIS